MEHKLIEAIQMFPCVYDKSKQDYRNKLKKEKSWDSVAATTGATVEQCQTRWRSLRDRYVKEMASAKPKSGAAAEERRRWCYLDAMSFLQKHVAPGRTFGNMQWCSSEPETCEETFDVELLEESYSFDKYSEDETPNKKPKRCEKGSTKIRNEANEKFDMLCGAVSDLISAKKDTVEKSRNADILKVLDSYLLKHSEEEQDELKMQILNLVYKGK